MALAEILEDPHKIERINLSHKGGIESELRGDVIRRAGEYFGYTTGEEFDASLPLAKALVELEIAPLNALQVEQYKASKERTESVLTSLIVFAICIWITIGGAVVFLLWLSRVTPENWNPGWKWLSGFFAWAVVCIGGAFATRFADRRFPSVERAWHWERFILGREPVNGVKPYPRNVPLHILNLAVQVREKLPGKQANGYSIPPVQFEVEELQLSIENIGIPLLDPFLWAVYGSERYCIGVWDERDFESRE